MKAMPKDHFTPFEHIRVRLLRHLLRLGVESFSQSHAICTNSIPRLQTYLARKRVWIVVFVCTLSSHPKPCKRCLCYRSPDGAVSTVTICITGNEQCIHKGGQHGLDRCQKKTLPNLHRLPMLGHCIRISGNSNPICHSLRRPFSVCRLPLGYSNSILHFHVHMTPLL